MSEFAIGPAREDELVLLGGIERRAARLFEAFEPGFLPPEAIDFVESLEDFQAGFRESRLLVARARSGLVVGFALCETLGGQGHLEEVDVEPDYGGRGIGRRLVEASCDWAREQGFERITLSTFRDVPWNEPFYARLGFEVIPEHELAPALRERREREAQHGLDPARRVMMVRELGAAAEGPSPER